LEDDLDSALSGLDPARKAELVDALGEEIFDELLESFFNDARDLLADAAASLNSDDTAEWDKALHTLKGAAANVGFKHVAELAQQLREEKLNRDRFEILTAMVANQQRHLAA
jgi:two-component system, sensor histidine kinase